MGHIGVSNIKASPVTIKELANGKRKHTVYFVVHFSENSEPHFKVFVRL